MTRINSQQPRARQEASNLGLVPPAPAAPEADLSILLDEARDWLQRASSSVGGFTLWSRIKMQLEGTAQGGRNRALPTVSHPASPDGRSTGMAELDMRMVPGVLLPHMVTGYAAGFAQQLYFALQEVEVRIAYIRNQLPTPMEDLPDDEPEYANDEPEAGRGA